MPRRSRTATARFTPDHYARLKAVASEKGISVSELIRRMTAAPDETARDENGDSPNAWLDGDTIAAELRVFDMRLDGIANVVEKKLGEYDQLVEELAKLTSALGALVATLEAQTLGIERTARPCTCRKRVTRS